MLRRTALRAPWARQPRLVTNTAAAIFGTSAGSSQRWYTASTETNTLSAKNGSGQSFAALGVDSRIAAAIAALYKVTTPTRMQTDLIPQLIEPDAHLYVRQTTGSGKTFSVLCALLSVAIQEHHLLTTKLKCTPAKAHEIQALNTLLVVPNRELALQIGRWAGEILEHAYPKIPRTKIIQCVVGGEEYEKGQRGLLKRHGMPAILVGTPRTIVELMGSTHKGAPLVSVLPSEILRRLKPIADEKSEDYVQRLHRIHTRCKRSNKQIPAAGGLRGLRRLVIDEVDQVLSIPGKHATEKEKRMRKNKPKPGQSLIDRVLLETCGLSRLNAVLQQASLLGWQKQVAEEAEETAKRRSSTKRWAKDRDPILGPPDSPAEQAVAEHEESDSEVLRLRSMADLVGQQSLQIVALSATANSNARKWMQKRGWMSSRPLVIDNENIGVAIPEHVTHYCLVIENQDTIRNFQAKDEAAENSELAMKRQTEELGVWEADVKERSAEEQLSAMELMAEVAANTLQALDPRGSVIIFTRSDASTSQFAQVLERYGILARDIMVHFDATLQSRVEQAIGQQTDTPKRRVFIATEEAARGIDVTDTSLVMILDIPKNVASYTHMAGRTGRFGRPGTVVSVVPVGKLGWYESKMRGIFSLLEIQPSKAPFVEG
ncbi:hypothetical protein IWW50_002581 [Coemansia erecta]|nr:hypothetical protein IWW50_002581 [Coemansia erecta]